MRDQAGRPGRVDVGGGRDLDVGQPGLVEQLGLAGVVAANLAAHDSPGHPATAPTTSAVRPTSSATRTSASAAAVDVSTHSLVGQPVSAVVSQLRQQGLVPRVVWQPSDQQRPGRVTTVWPTGPQPPGSVVTVVRALKDTATATAAPSSPPASTADDNGNGNG